MKTLLSLTFRSMYFEFQGNISRAIPTLKTKTLTKRKYIIPMTFFIFKHATTNGFISESTYEKSCFYEFTKWKTKMHNTQDEDFGIFFSPKFGECIFHPFDTISGETTNIPCTKAEMNSEKDVIYGLSQTSFQQ